MTPASTIVDLPAWLDPAARSWRNDAACRDLPLDMFFIPVGQSGDQAKAICADCDVRTDCLEDTLRYSTTADTSGIRAGLTGKQRGAIRAARRRAEQDKSAKAAREGAGRRRGSGERDL